MIDTAFAKRLFKNPAFGCGFVLLVVGTGPLVVLILLDAIGAFDAERYGRGFGEENDFAERAKAAGWKVRLADDVYVLHEGKASFGDEGAALQREHAEVLAGQHPGYGAAVAHFIAKNPRESAEIFVRIENTKLPVDFIARMISDPEFSYAPEPQNVMKIYRFMNKVGALKNMPANWQDLFFPEAHALNGN